MTERRLKRDVSTVCRALRQVDALTMILDCRDTLENAVGFCCGTSYRAWMRSSNGEGEKKERRCVVPCCKMLRDLVGIGNLSVSQERSDKSLMQCLIEGR